MEESELSGTGSRISGGTAEELIAALREHPASRPYCWIICYEERPLQGAPQGSMEPHLMIFTTKAIGTAFIQGRRRYFGPEPVQLVPVDSAGTLLKLALAEANDPRYTAPPCGLLLNFSYSTARADVTLSPEEVQESGVDQLAEALGLKIKEPARARTAKDKTIEETPPEEETVDASLCPLCHHRLYMPQRGGGISIGFGDDALEAMMSRQRPDLAHTAYACKKCGTRICQTCATKYVCPRCKNNTFDRFDLAALPPPPPLGAKPKAAKPKKPRAATAEKKAPTEAVKAPAPAAPVVPAVKAEAPAAPVISETMENALVAAVRARYDAEAPAAKPAAQPAPKWWMIAALAALVLVIALLAIRPWEAKTADEKPVGLSDIRTAAAMTAVAFQPVTESPTSAIVPLTIIRGPNQWTLTQVIFVDNLNIPEREKRSAPEGSVFLLVSFRCDTARNPILVLDPGGPKAPLSLYKPEGIMGLSVTDETGVNYPVQVVEVFDTADAPDGFFLMAIVPESKSTYVLHFLDSPTLPLDPALIPEQDEAPAEEPEQAEAPTPEPAPTEAVVLPTLPPFAPIALPGGEAFGEVVALSPNATYAASGNCNGMVRLWETASREVFRDYSSSDADCVADIAFTAGEDRMAVAFTNQGTIFVYDVSSGELQGKLFMPRVDAVAISPRGNWLAAGSQGHGTALWDMTKFAEMQGTEWEPVLIEGRLDNFFTCLEFDPSGDFLAIGEGSGGVKVWDLKAGQVAHSISANCEAPRSMSFSLDRQYGGFLYFSDFQSQNVVNLTTGDLNVVRTFPFKVDSGSAFVPRMEFTALIITQPGKSSIELWNNYEGKLLNTLEGHKGPVYSMQFSPDGALLLSGGNSFAYPDSGEVFLWNTSEILP